MAYATQRSTRLGGLVLAVLMATVVNGAMLWKMDTIAHNGAHNNSYPAPSYITLETVTIVGHQS